MGFDYMGMSYQEQKARQGVPAWAIFGLSLLFVFLVLAALYESWSLPWSVLLSTPVAVFGALVALWLRRVVLGWFLPPYMVQMENDVYTQIGLVMLIGSGRQEFNSDRRVRQRGVRTRQASGRGRPGRSEASVPAPHDDRARVIVGCVPLWIASGAGAIARQIIGTTVIGGMLAETFIGRFFVRRSSTSLRNSQALRNGKHCHSRPPRRPIWGTEL